MHSLCQLPFCKHSLHKRQAVGWDNEASLSNTLLGWSVTVTALLVSFSILSCCEVTDFVPQDSKTSSLGGNRPSQVVVVRFPFKYGQFCSMTCCGVLSGYLPMTGRQVPPTRRQQYWSRWEVTLTRCRQTRQDDFKVGRATVRIKTQRRAVKYQTCLTFFDPP